MSDHPIPPTTRAVRHGRYGNSEVLEMVEVDTPSVTDDTVLVHVEAAALNPLDWHMMTGTPWLVRLQNGLRSPKRGQVGVDLAGRVVAVGAGVTDHEVGDDVVGVASGSCAEYVIASPERIVPKPADVSFPESAGMGVAALTALQGLRDKAEVGPGQHVLVNGSSGGVGLAAVQLAKWMGAEVTAVCSSRNVELVRSMGADHVVDYTADDFTDTNTRYDVVFDNQGNRTLRQIRRILTPEGTYLIVGGPKDNRAFGPMLRMAKALLRFSVGSQRACSFIAEQRLEDLLLLAELMESGDLQTVVDRTTGLDDIRDAMDHLATGHARGKVVITP